MDLEHDSFIKFQTVFENNKNNNTLGVKHSINFGTCKHLNNLLWVVLKCVVMMIVKFSMES